jgi:cell division initiation protein
MELTPQTVRATGFKTIRKGYDPAEVDIFKERVASAIESAQNQATAMEARARAAVAKLQELTQAGAAPKDESSATPAAGATTVAEEQAAPAPAAAELRSDDAETISRTLLLAQRTADTTDAAAMA